MSPLPALSGSMRASHSTRLLGSLSGNGCCFWNRLYHLQKCLLIMVRTMGDILHYVPFVSSMVDIPFSFSTAAVKVMVWRRFPGLSVNATLD
jgi:hypothetical protein